MAKKEPRTLTSNLFGKTGNAEVLFEVKLTELSPNPHQPRKSFNPEGIAELASSLDQDGQLQPIAVVSSPKGGYTIVLGERRYRAAKHLKRKTITARILPDDSDLQKLALIENLQREDLHPLEEAEGLFELMQSHDIAQGELGKVVGKARKTVNELLLLNKLPEPIKKEWRTSATSAPKSTMVEIVRIDTPAKQLSLWEQVKAGGVTVKSAREKKEGRVACVVPSPANRALSAGHTFAARLIKLDSRLLRSKSLRAELTKVKEEIDGLYKLLLK